MLGPTVTNHYSVVDALTGQLVVTSLDGSRHLALYDLVDLGVVSAHHWHVHTGGYAASLTIGAQGRQHIYMHRMLLGLVAGDRREVDHRNGDRLDNRRANLRTATRIRNAQNQAIINERGSSKYRGVYWYSRVSKWVAKAGVGGRKHHLGYFATEQEAAAAVAAFRAEQDVLAGYPRRHQHTPSQAGA